MRRRVRVAVACRLAMLLENGIEERHCRATDCRRRLRVAVDIATDGEQNTAEEVVWYCNERRAMYRKTRRVLLCENVVEESYRDKTGVWKGNGSRYRERWIWKYNRTGSTIGQ